MAHYNWLGWQRRERVSAAMRALLGWTSGAATDRQGQQEQEEEGLDGEGEGGEEEEGEEDGGVVVVVQGVNGG